MFDLRIFDRTSEVKVNLTYWSERFENFGELLGRKMFPDWVFFFKKMGRKIPTDFQFTIAHTEFRIQRQINSK